MINKISLKKRFSANVLVDSNGDVVEITDDMHSYLRLKYRSRHFWINTVENCLEITDVTDSKNEEVIFLSDPNPSQGRLHEKIARKLAVEVRELNYNSICTLAEVAMKVTNLLIVILPEEY
jgi:predicted phosphatase